MRVALATFPSTPRQSWRGVDIQLEEQSAPKESISSLVVRIPQCEAFSASAAVAARDPNCSLKVPLGQAKAQRRLETTREIRLMTEAMIAIT